MKKPWHSDDPKVRGALRHFLGAFGPLFSVIASMIGSGLITLEEALIAMLTNWETLVGVLLFWLALRDSMKDKDQRNDEG